MITLAVTPRGPRLRAKFFVSATRPGLAAHSHILTQSQMDQCVHRPVTVAVRGIPSRSSCTSDPMMYASTRSLASRHMCMMGDAPQPQDSDSLPLKQRVPTRNSSWASTEASRRTMQSNRGRDTRFELRVRSALHKRGLRYRVNHRPVANIRRTADIVFARSQVAVMLDGCFWHGCPDHFVMPRTNTAWWKAKFARNRERDIETSRLLNDAGWLILRFWEHESTDEIVDKIETTVRGFLRPYT